MKKFFQLTAAVAMAFTLAGCSDTQTAQQIFDNTMERQKELTSASATMDVSQTMTVSMDGETGEIVTLTKGTVDAVFDPIAMAMDVNVSTDFMGEPMELPVNMYINETDGMYLEDTTSNTWMKLPSEQFDTIMNNTDVQIDQTAQLEQLQQFVEDFTMEETDASYVLTLNLDDEKFNSLVKEQAAGALGDSGTEADNAALESIQISDGLYKLTIDKETYDLTNVIMDFFMTMEVEGETMEMDTNSNITYTEFNHLQSIDIPQNIIDSAVDMTDVQ